MTRQALLTYRDYAALPDDGKRYELHDGALSVTPAPAPRHQQVSRNLFRVLDAHVTANDLGEILYSPIDVILSDVTVVQPDIVWLAADRLDRISRRGIEGAPTLVVEILSPSTVSIDRVIKRRLYARHGVPWLWLVNPEARALEVYRGDERVLVASGPEPVDLPPFESLGLIVDSLWP